MSENNQIGCVYFSEKKCFSCSRFDLADRHLNLTELFGNLVPYLKDWQVAPKTLGLRAKARMSVTGTYSNPVIGILNKELQGIDLIKCPQHRKIILEFLKCCPQIIEELKLTPYDISNRTGELKSIILQTNRREDHLRIRFVLRSELLIEKLERIDVKKFPFNVSISANIQPIPHQIPEGSIERHLIGSEVLWEEYNGVKVAFPSEAFMQVNPEIASMLYSSAAFIVKKYSDPVVLDLFCGAGGFALSVARYAKKVFAYEISSRAVDFGKISTAENGYQNVFFEQADLLTSFDAVETIKPDILICNPPRRGLGAELIGSILKHPSKILIYSSCNSKSFLSDFEQLKNLYDIVEITPFEMFPLTNHCEILVEMNLRT